MQVEDRREVAAIGQGQDDGAAGPGAEGGRRRRDEIRRAYPIGSRSAERQLKAQRAFKVGLGRQAVGRQRSGRRRDKRDCFRLFRSVAISRKWSSA